MGFMDQEAFQNARTTFFGGPVGWATFPSWGQNNYYGVAKGCGRDPIMGTLP